MTLKSAYLINEGSLAMMTFIREKSQGWFAWLIVGSICLVFALWGVRSYLYSAQAGNTVAKVNGTNITQQQLSVVYNQFKRQKEMSLGANYSPSKVSSTALKKKALQSIISNVVLTNAATSAGFRAAPELVEATLVKMPVFQVNGAFSEARFQQVLNGMMYSPDQLFNEISDNILVGQLQFGFINSAFALPSEVKQAIQLINQRRTFVYAVLPVSRFLSSVKLPQNAVNDYYKQNPKEFQIPASVSIEYIQLSVSGLMKKINPTAEQIKSYYETNIASYTKPKKWQLAHILISVPMRVTASQKAKAKKKIDLIVSEIKAGQKFSSLANKYSNDKMTAYNGGVLAWRNEGQFASELRPVLRNLKKNGDISTPVYVAGQGYEILKVINMRSAIILPFSSVKKKVFQAYKQRQAERQFADMSDQLSNITYESPNSLQPAAKKLGLTIQTTPMFTKSGKKVQKILQNPKVIEMAFSDEVVSQNDNSDPVNLNDNVMLVLRAKKYVPAKVKPLSEVSAVIEKKLKSGEATKQAQARGKQILAALDGGLSQRAAASKYRFSWKLANNAGRNSRSINMGILMLAFKSPVPSKTMMKVNTGDSLGNGNFAVISLSRVIPGSTNLSRVQKTIYGKGTENAFGQLEYMAYVNGLMKKAKIKKFKQAPGQ